MKKLKSRFENRMRLLVGTAGFILAFLTIASIVNPAEFAGLLGTSGASLAVVLVVGIKHESETDEQFAERLLMEKVQKSVRDDLAAYKASNPGFDESKLTAITEQLKGLAKLSEIDALKAALNEIGLKVTGLEENPKVQKGNSFGEQVKSFFKENKEKIAAIHKSGAGVIELELKSVGDITAGSGVSFGTVPDNQIVGNPSFNLIGNFIDSLVSTSDVSTPSLPYTEMLPKDGDFTFLGEGATKQQIDFKWETRYATPKKAAAWVRLTTEVVQDIKRMESLTNELLLKKHNIKKQRAIISGDGIGDNPKGITKYGRSFVAGSMAGSVVTPNLMDVINMKELRVV